jgi:hypothetical protein
MKYKFDYMLPTVLEVAQQELAEFLKEHEPTEFADLRWFESQYGHELPLQDIMKLWYAVPNIRAGQYTEWSSKLPKLSEIAKSLPGIVNFSLNAIAPGGQAPVHSDYSFDMRKDLSGVDQAYVILLGVDVPENCEFRLDDKLIPFTTGSIFAFDGAIPHGSWNNSDKWRYTINMDLKAEYWDV